MNPFSEKIVNDQIRRKRRFNGQESDYSIPRRFNSSDPEDLTLSLSPAHLYQPPAPSSHPIFASTPIFIPPLTLSFPENPNPSPKAPAPRPPRARRNPSQIPREGKSLIIQPPFEWATDRRATVHTLNYLLSKQISIISGEVVCKKCERQYTMELDLLEKFQEMGSYVRVNKARLCERAPPIWMNPKLPSCQFCGQENSVKPVMANKKKSINWLFLLLSQMLGCCTLDQLKYFCKHTNNHRTGAKDRVLFLAYLSLCKQLDPTGPFDRI